MRGARSLLVLLVLAAGLGAYIYFVESKRDPAATEVKAKLFDLDATTISDLEITVPGQPPTVMKKNGEAWTITAPIATAADTTTVGAVVAALATTEIERTLEDAPADLAPFGLDAPVATVAFKTTGDSTMRKMLLGAKTPTGSTVYAKVDGRAGLVLIPGYLEETFKKTTFDVRDKRALVIDRELVDAVTVAATGQAPSVALARKDGAWRLTTPLDAKADFTPVDALVGRAVGATMTSIVHEGSEPSPAQLQTYGLTTPQVVTTLGAGSNRASLAIGGKKDESSVYARDLSRPIIFTVDAGILPDLRKGADDFRVKTVFEFQPYAAIGLEATQSGTTVAFTKSKPAGGTEAAEDVWKQTTPQARDINQTAATDLLNTLASLRIDTFAASAPATGTDVVFAVRAGDQAAPTEERVTLRKSGTTAYVIRQGDPGAGVIPATDFDRALSQLHTLTSAK